MIIQPGKEKAWEHYKEINSHDHVGTAVLSFAVRWADMMEARCPNYGEGDSIPLVSDEIVRLSHDADTEGITGAMYNAAVAALVHFWKRGESLRIWHNVHVQLNGEGVEANRTGGVLNSAILSFKEKPNVGV